MKQTPARRGASNRAQMRRLRASYRRRLAIFGVLFFILGVAAGFFGYRWYVNSNPDAAEPDAQGAVEALQTLQPIQTPDGGESLPAEDEAPTWPEAVPEGDAPDETWETEEDAPEWPSIETPAEETVVEAQPEETPAEEAAVEEQPEETPAEEATVEAEPEETPAEEAAVEAEPEETPAEEAAVEAQPEETPAEEMVVEAKPEETPAEEATVEAQPEETPAEEAAVEAKPEETPAEAEPVEAPVEETPTEAEAEETPVEETPAEAEPVEAEPEETPVVVEPEEVAVEAPTEEVEPEPTPAGPQVIAIVPYGESFTYSTQIRSDGSARLDASDDPFETISFTQTMKDYMRPTDFASKYSTQYKLQGNEAGAGFELVLNDYEGTATIIPQNVIDVSLRSESGNSVERGYQLMDAEIAGNYGIALTPNSPRMLYKRYQYTNAGEEMYYLVVTTYNDGNAQMILFELEDHNPQPEPEIVYNTLQRGIISDDVANMQARLIELGYLRGVADGQFGPMTEEAIKAAQADFGMEENGVADNAFQQKLFEGAEPTPAPEEEGAQPEEGEAVEEDSVG